MSPQRQRLLCLAALSMVAILTLRLRHVELETLLEGRDLLWVTDEEDVGGQWRDLHLPQYPLHDPALTCNPALLTKTTAPPPAPFIPGPTGFCSNASAFSTIGSEAISISDDCRGVALVVASDGYRLDPPVNVTTPSSVPLGNRQQFMIKCLGDERVDIHLRVLPPSAPAPLASQRPHVLLLVLDSVSRAQFVRQFKQTAAVLRRVGAGTVSDHHELYAFHRVSTGGVGTAGNLVPVLGGSPLRRWRHAHSHLDGLNHSRVHRHIDDGNLFNRFRSAGYLTSLMDQSGPHWSSSLVRYFSSTTATNYDLDAIIAGMTDWSMYSMMDPLLKFGASFDPRLLYAASNFTALCVGRQTLEQVEFERLRQMLAIASGRRQPLFSVSLFNTGHEPRVRRAASVDAPLAEFVEQALVDHPNIALIIMSDHGIGYGPYASSDVGVFENKLPLLLMALPDDMGLTPTQRRHAHVNQDRLVFPLDLHNALAWLATGDRPIGTAQGATSSLFEDTIPPWRNCTSVVDSYDVDYKFCACIVKKPLASSLFAMFASIVLRSINDEVAGRPACERIELTSPSSWAVHSLDEFPVEDAQRIGVKVWVSTPSTKANTHRSLEGSEIFTGYFFRKSSPSIATIAIGQNWDAANRMLLGPSLVIDLHQYDDVVLRVTLTHEATLRHRRPTRVILHFVGQLTPKRIRSQPILRFAIGGDRRSFHWRFDDRQRRQLIPGHWRAVIYRRRRVVSNLPFFVFDSSNATTFADQRLEHIWQVDTIRRETEFGQYEACAGPGPTDTLPFCLCNVSRPILK